MSIAVTKPPVVPDRSRAQQMRALGVGVDAYQGLIVLEIEGPPIVALTPLEARRFFAFLTHAYRDAVHDQDALVDPRNLRSAHGEPEGSR